MPVIVWLTMMIERSARFHARLPGVTEQSSKRTSYRLELEFGAEGDKDAGAIVPCTGEPGASWTSGLVKRFTIGDRAIWNRCCRDSEF